MNIVVLDGYCLNPGDLDWKQLTDIGDVTIYDRTKPTELLSRAKDADALLTNKTIINTNAIEASPKLKYIGVLATGYNVVDTSYASKKGIVVTNIPAYSTMSVVQMVWAHILNITQHVAQYATQNRQGAWSHCSDFSYTCTPLIELCGKTIGIVGLGNIGMAVAKVALTFGMNVIALTSKKELPNGIKSVTKEELFQSSDIVSLHCPLNEQTKHIINSLTLSMMKPTAILINTGRGPLIDEQALATALQNNTIMAAGLDVLSTEPPQTDNPLLSLHNCYTTPHIAWATTEARQRLMNIATENIKAFKAGCPINKIN